MKLSQVLLLSERLFPHQAFGNLIRGVDGEDIALCAWASVIAVVKGYTYPSLHKANVDFSDEHLYLRYVPRACPIPDCFAITCCGAPTVRELIVHLNDSHKLSRHEIAHHLMRSGLDQDIPVHSEVMEKVQAAPAPTYKPVAASDLVSEEPTDMLEAVMKETYQVLGKTYASPPREPALTG